MIASNGTRASSVISPDSVHIETTAMGNRTSVLPRYMSPGPAENRTASTSLVSREIRSPVRVRSKYPAGRCSM